MAEFLIGHKLGSWEIEKCRGCELPRGSARFFSLHLANEAGAVNFLPLSHCLLVDGVPVLLYLEFEWTRVIYRSIR
jgi:hypothetical protein